MNYCPRCDQHIDPAETRCPGCGGRPTQVEVDELPRGVLDGKYEVRERIGAGGMGAVYRAFQVSLEREVALKVLRREVANDRVLVQRFFNEARAVARLRSPHTIRVFDFAISDQGLLYFTMEMLHGQSLRALLSQEGRLPFERAAELLGQACDSLHEAHEAGLIHRDLKPENLFVTEDLHGRDFVTVLDFGIAKRLDAAEKLTQSGEVCGTAAYVAPEALLGEKVDRRADVYALGIVLYELLSGEPPFTGDTPTSILVQHVNDPPPPLKLRSPKLRVPEAVEQFLQQALAKDPASRPATAAVFAQRLLELKAQAGVSRANAPTVVDGPVTKTSASQRRPRSAGLLVGLAVATSVLLVVLAYFLSATPPYSGSAAGTRVDAGEVIAPVGAPGAGVTRSAEVQQPEPPEAVDSGVTGREARADEGPGLTTTSTAGQPRGDLPGSVRDAGVVHRPGPRDAPPVAPDEGKTPSPSAVSPAELFRQQPVEVERAPAGDLFKQRPVLDEGARRDR